LHDSKNKMILFIWVLFCSIMLVQIISSHAEQEPSVPDCPVADVEFGYSPFELEIAHAKHSDSVCLDFYETVQDYTARDLNM
jgi:hypothetical protein